MRLRATLIALLLTTNLACSQMLELPAASLPLPQRPVRGALRVGTARADITPPPGASTFGHGPEARVADGYWTRLYCRVFYFEVEGGERLAIIPCELSATSTLLHRRVAEIALRELDLPASRIMLPSVHTHAAPAHYFDGVAYGGAGSSRLPGYDERMVAFLAESIAAALRKAKESAQPAKLAWSHQESLWGLVRNRNLNPYRRNSAPFPYKPPASLKQALADQDLAIDPALDVLRIDDEGGRPIGSLSFFAMHPTVLPGKNRLFGADTHGVISRAIEREMRRSAAIEDPLHGVINTNEGDIIPVFARGTYDEAIEVGERLSSKVWQAYRAPEVGVRLAEESTPQAVTLSARYLEVDLPGAVIRSSGDKLCRSPATGLGMPSGSREHSTWMGATIPEEFYEGNRDPNSKSCQAPKRPIGGPIQQVFSSADGYPSRIPLSLVRLEDTWIAFTPAEMTVMAGKEVKDRILARVTPALGAPQRAIIGGLSNGYIQYVTTAPEYELQYYEGASTLYGKWTSGVLSDRFDVLAGAMVGVDPGPALAEIQEKEGLSRAPRLDDVSSYKVGVGVSRKRFDDGEDEAPLASIASLRKPIGLCRIRGHESPPVFCFWWSDGGPGRVAVRGGQGPYIRLVHDKGRAPVVLSGAPLVPGLLPSARDPRAVVDDTGLDFMTRAHDQGDGGVWYWSTLFHPTRAEWAELAGMGAFRIEARSASPEVAGVVSKAFSGAALPPFCSVEAQEYCGLRE